MSRRREPETALIESSTHDGRGIAALEGKKVFVAGALPGETVRFQRRKRKRNFDEAELLEVIDASPDRIEPRCAVYGTCGGCALQHSSNDEQRTIKEQALRDSLERIGRVSPAEWLPPLFNEDRDGSWRYRRRARLAVKDVAGKGRVLVGFRERHAPFLTDMLRCEVLAEPLDGMLGPLSDLIGGLSIRKRLPQIEVAVADNAVALIFRVLDSPTDADRQALADFARDQGIRLLLQPGGMDSVTPLYPPPPLADLHYRLDAFNVEIEFDAADFVQVNGRVNQLMVAAAIAHLEVGAGNRVLDLYCGIGNFSLPMARSADTVLGVEGEAHQVRRATANARRNGIANCEFLRADLDRIDGGEAWLNRGWDRVLLDPARSGAAALADCMAQIGPERVVYVSCHPGTLARDAGTLVHSQGYDLVAAGIIDMFPHTGHVESLAVFRKRREK